MATNFVVFCSWEIDFGGLLLLLASIVILSYLISEMFIFLGFKTGYYYLLVGSGVLLLLFDSLDARC